MHGKEIGLWLSAWQVLPFLKAGAISALLQSPGSWPLSMENWKILARQGASSSPSSLRSRPGILYGPDALFILRWDSNLATPGGLLCKEEILGWVGPGSSVMEDRSSSVNTDSNCSLSIFDLSELPFFFKGATPGESLRVDLMYFQKGLVSPSSKALLIMPSMKRPEPLWVPCWRVSCKRCTEPRPGQTWPFLPSCVVVVCVCRCVWWNLLTREHASC